jgi:hypothetical protein
VSAAMRSIGSKVPSRMTNAFARIIVIASSMDGAREVTAPQVGQGEQGLTAGGKTPPPRSDLLPSVCQLPGQEPQGAAGQINRGRVDKHAKLLADTGNLGREPGYQELCRCAGLSNSRSHRQLGGGLVIERAGDHPGTDRTGNAREKASGSGAEHSETASLGVRHDGLSEGVRTAPGLERGSTISLWLRTRNRLDVVARTTPGCSGTDQGARPPSRSAGRSPGSPSKTSSAATGPRTRWPEQWPG